MPDPVKANELPIREPYTGAARIITLDNAGVDPVLAQGPQIKNLIPDVDWSDETANLINGWTAGTFEIRRWGPIVEISFENLNPAAATGVDLFLLPLGHRPRNNFATGSASLGGGTGTGFIGVRGGINVFANNAGAPLYGTLTFLTDDAAP